MHLVWEGGGQLRPGKPAKTSTWNRARERAIFARDGYIGTKKRLFNATKGRIDSCKRTLHHSTGERGGWTRQASDKALWAAEEFSRQANGMVNAKATEICEDLGKEDWEIWAGLAANHVKETFRKSLIVPLAAIGSAFATWISLGFWAEMGKSSIMAIAAAAGAATWLAIHLIVGRIAGRGFRAVEENVDGFLKRLEFRVSTGEKQVSAEIEKLMDECMEVVGKGVEETGEPGEED